MLPVLDAADQLSTPPTWRCDFLTPTLGAWTFAERFEKETRLNRQLWQSIIFLKKIKIIRVRCCCKKTQLIGLDAIKTLVKK